MKIVNTLPDKAFSIQVEIPANTPTYTQTFANSLSLDKKKTHFISRATLVVDPASIYNIRNDESVEFYTNNPDSLTSRIIIAFKAGYYSLDKILTLFNRYDVQRPAITINRTGEYAYKTQINYYSRVGNTPNVGFQLIFKQQNSSIQNILGMYYPETPSLRTFCTSTALTRGPRNNKNIIVTNNTTYIAPYIFDSTGGFDTIFCTCDLIKQSSLISQNYLISASISYDQLLVYTTECAIPLVKFNISQINWRLTNRFNQPFDVNKPIDIFLSILSQDK